MKIKKATMLLILDILIAITLMAGCSKITEPGAVVEAPDDNSIAVIGFTGSACTNCDPSPQFNIVWYDVIVVEDMGANINSVPDRINLRVKDEELNHMFSLKPYRTVLVARKAGKYWRLIKIVKNQ